MVTIKSLVEMNNVKCEICGMEMKMVYIAVADLGGAHPAPPPPPWSKIFSISCSFSENLTKSYVAPPRGLAPSPTGNPGSAPA